MKTYEITYLLKSRKQTIIVEASDEVEAGKKFTKMAPDVSVDNVLSVIDQKKKRNEFILSRIIVNTWSILLEFSLWLLLLVGLIAGWEYKGFFGGIAGLFGAFIFGSIFLGAFLVLEDIRKYVKEIADSKKL